MTPGRGSLIRPFLLLVLVLTACSGGDAPRDRLAPTACERACERLRTLCRLSVRDDCPAFCERELSGRIDVECVARASGSCDSVNACPVFLDAGSAP